MPADTLPQMANEVRRATEIWDPHCEGGEDARPSRARGWARRRALGVWGESLKADLWPKLAADGDAERMCGVSAP